jgi:hypothetical protein
MPRREVGQFVEPGASAATYVRPLTESGLAEALDDLARKARARERTNAATALAALSGSDPLTYPISSTVRAKVVGVLRRHATELATVRADPRRRFLNREGIEAEETGLRAVHAKEFAALEAELTQKVETLRARLADRLDTLRGAGVTDDDWRNANEFADRLTRLGPELGLPELVAFLNQAGTEERSTGELKALLPLLEAAYRHPTSPWRSRDELRRICAIGESLTDGGATASIIEARLERAQKLAGDLAVFLILAREGSVNALEAHITGGEDHGRYALFPSDELPPDGPPPEDRQVWLEAAEAHPFRRISLSAQQRATDAEAHALNAQHQE